ncbi:MAG: glycine--tRNA ligase [Dehalococcoidia bacterium]|nr:glycine--tRNA ligase [Dehalococcoidia bacterium]
MEKIVSLCKRRGFIFQSSEIYGGMGGCWDYGPLGVELKRNVKNAWWRAVVQERDDVVGLDASILMHPQVWVASGHVENFTDLLSDCKACKHRFRADHVKDGKCPDCGGELTAPRKFNLMFRTFVGPVEDSASMVYLRPETAQGIFADYETVQGALRKKPPFGIAQVGKAFRNEITPGNFTFRTREFEQMEIEFFVKPGTDEKWHKDWLDARFAWYAGLGIRKDRLRLREHAKDELAHYAKACFDVEYLFPAPLGWSEIEGIANRTDFDLKQHSKYSGKDLSFFDEETKERYTPYVIEPSAGADRGSLAFLLDAYDEEEVPSASSGRGETRVVLRFHPDIAPIKVAVLPLSKKETLVPTAREVHAEVRRHVMSQYDDAQSIGRRYRRQDETGTPLCVTVDFQTLEDKAVTIRERDTMQQVRVPIAEVTPAVRRALDGGWSAVAETYPKVAGKE